MSPRLRRILKGIGYGAFYLLCLFVFAAWTFPYERVKTSLISAFNARQSGDDPMRLEIDELSSYWLSGIEAEGVRLTSAAPNPEAQGEAGEPKVVTIEHAHVSVSLLRLLFGTTHASFGADAFGGEISGFTSSSEEARQLEVELEDVDVGQLPMLAEIVELPMTGSLNGTIDLKLPEQKLGQAEGAIEFEVSEMTVGDGKAKIRDTIALPRIRAGDLVLQAEANEGRVDIEEMSAEGKDLQLQANGQLRLNDPFERSLADLSFRFRFTDAYRNKNDVTRGLFGKPGSKVPGVFEIDPKIKRSKSPDGFYGWRITGSLARLNFRPDPRAGRGGSGGGRGRPKKKRR